jgi:acetylornithine aminotransferase
MPDAGYLDGIRKICDANGWLMMLDEIQTGVGRTGEWFAWQHGNARPDVITLAKALGNGVPIGACLARGTAADVMQPGRHGTTFGGNPLACRAAIAVLETITQDGLVAQADELGKRMHNGFAASLAGLAGVIDIRGLGLMLGIELDRPCSELVGRALQGGLLINVTAERVVRLLPPLIMTDKQADIVVTQVSELIRDFLTE